MCEGGPVVVLSEILDEATVCPVIELLVLLIEADASSVHHSEVAPHVVHIFDSNVSDVHFIPCSPVPLLRYTQLQ
jgi:hypothetical protein